MRWFGFGFNAFGQICDCERLGDVNGVKVTDPTECSTGGHADGSRRGQKSSGIRASWSRRVSLPRDGGSCVSLWGFGGGGGGGGVPLAESRGCEDAAIGESYLILAFPDRVESWDLEKRSPAWRMDAEAQSECSGSLRLPLAAGGYITTTPPFYHSLSPQLKAKSLALGGEHAVLLSATGAVYTWGLGSHGELGHGGLASEEEPRVVEALWGMPMSDVAAGGWHTACISDGGDLYVWGWNESGQLGFPSQAMRKTQQQSSRQADPSTSSREDSSEDEENKEVFISMQAFPALLDVTPTCEIKTVGCGSRHTAAVTTTGDLYTWGWGEYGQLGYQTSCSDEPQRVEFFRQQQMCVVDVVCGAWNTFAAAVKEEAAVS